MEYSSLCRSIRKCAKLRVTNDRLLIVVMASSGEQDMVASYSLGANNHTQTGRF